MSGWCPFLPGSGPPPEGRGSSPPSTARLGTCTRHFPRLPGASGKQKNLPSPPPGDCTPKLRMSLAAAEQLVRGLLQAELTSSLRLCA